MTFEKGNKLARFTGMKHKPESNAKRAETMKRLHAEGSVPGMGFKSPYSTEEERQRARLSSQMKCRYGITLQDYESILGEQGGGCAICDTMPTVRRLHIDHDHTTGEVRGLLCGHCNQLLGLAGDSLEVLCEASIYLSERRPTASRAIGVVGARLARSAREDEARWKAYGIQKALGVHRG